MINSVSAVSFQSNASAAQDPISRPSTFSKPESAPKKSVDAAPEKKGGFLKGLASVVVAAVVVGGALLAGFKKGGLKVLDETALKDAKFMQKVGHYLGKAGEWVDAKIWQKLPGVAKKAGEAAEEVAEKTEKVADEVAEAATEVAANA